MTAYEKNCEKIVKEKRERKRFVVKWDYTVLRKSEGEREGERTHIFLFHIAAVLFAKSHCALYFILTMFLNASLK